MGRPKPLDNRDAKPNSEVGVTPRDAKRRPLDSAMDKLRTISNKCYEVPTRENNDEINRLALAAVAELKRVV